MLNIKNKTVQVKWSNHHAMMIMGIGHLPIMFIHGFPFDKSMWKPQMDFFKRKQRVNCL